MLSPSAPRTSTSAASKRRSVFAVSGPARPEAMSTMVSLVLVSPSTETLLKVASTARFRSFFSTAGEAFASVKTKPSVVAMSGWIIPAPFARPSTVAVRLAPSFTVLAATFGH